MKLHRLEAVRGFAATYVVAHHTLPHDLVVLGFNIGFLLRFGQEAVILFFLLSGFVINYSYRSKPLKPSEYFFNRFCRIYIPLLAAFLLSYGVAAATSGRTIDIDLAGLLGNLFMLQDISSLKPGVIVEPYMGNLPLWSLSYEWWFYVMYVPIMSYLGSWKSRSILVLLLACICATLYSWYPLWILRIGFYFSIWWCGALLAVPSPTGPANHARDALALLICCFGILFVGAWHSGSLSASHLGTHPVLELRHFLSAIFFVLFALAWQRAGWRGFRFLLSPFAILAPISYSLYILHAPLHRLLSPLSLQVGFFAAEAGFVVLLIVVGSLIELLIYPMSKRYLLGLWAAKSTVI